MAADASAHERTGQGRPSVKDTAIATFKEFKSDDVPEASAAVAYHAIFAIPPIIVFIISLAALVNRITSVPVAERLIDAINRSAPGETKELLRTIVENAVAQASGAGAITGILLAAAIALWSGANGIGAFIKAFNRAYDVEETRGFIKMKLITLGLTLLVGVLVIAATGLFVFGEALGRGISKWLGLGGAFETTWSIARWPLAWLFISFLLAVLYFLGPNVEQSFRWISPGSVVATLLWVAIAIGFSIYLNFSNPGSAYGALGSVVVLLFFLYLTAIAFTIGAEVNAVLGRRYDPETVEDLASNPEKVKDGEAQVEAYDRAKNMDRREGTSTSASAPKPGERGAEARRSGRPGFGGRIASGVWSLLLAFVIARFRRPSRN